MLLQSVVQYRVCAPTLGSMLNDCRRQDYYMSCQLSGLPY